MKRLGLSAASKITAIGPDADGAEVIEVPDDFEAYLGGCMEVYLRPDDTVSVNICAENVFQEMRKQKWDEVRAMRNSVIATTDWTQLGDVTLSDSDSTAWATYRQELRDMIDEDSNPFAVTWPTKPV